MWWAKRRATIEQTEPAEEELEAGTGELLEQIERLTETNRLAPSREAERRLLALRHLVGMRMVDEAPADPAFVAPADDQLPAGDPLPEVDAAELTPGLIRAGVLRDGCLLVRGLVATRPGAGDG